MSYLIDRISVYLQYFLWLLGFAIHNPVRNECVPNFACCCHKIGFAFIRIKEKINNN